MSRAMQGGETRGRLAGGQDKEGEGRMRRARKEARPSACREEGG